MTKLKALWAWLKGHIVQDEPEYTSEHIDYSRKALADNFPRPVAPERRRSVR